MPWFGYFGGVLMMLCWFLNWNLEGPRTHLLFFPLWLGFILLMNGLTMIKSGNCLIQRSPSKFVWLFFISVPGWWLFEIINLRTGNWMYEGRDLFTDTEYFLLASLSFSTVIPAVFSITELFYSFFRPETHWPGPVIKANRKNAILLVLTGFIMFFLTLIWPELFFIFVWTSLYLILEGVNYLAGYKSLLYFTESGNWRPFYLLALACLTCGFFWEMWNFYSFPKWVYRLPYLNFCHVFEMPVMGYLGYIPFSFELYTLYVFFVRIKKKDTDYFVLG